MKRCRYLRVSRHAISSHHNTISKVSNKTILSIIFFAGLVLTYYLTDLYLKSNFYESGEAYMKGAGHLLNEHFAKGIFFITTRHLLGGTFLFGFIFSLTSIQDRKMPFKILNILAIVVLGLTISYFIFKLVEIPRNGDNYQWNRIIEIALPWLFRVVALYTSYWLIKKLSGILDQIEHAC